jgi:hypothetical protein
MAIMRQLAHALGVMHVDALIQAVPGKAENTVGQANHLVGEVRGDLFHQRNGVLLRFLMRNFLAARFVFNGAGNRFGGQQLVEQILTRREARADGRQALTGEVHTRHARQFCAMILSVPCSSAMRRSETEGEKRTKLSRPSQETAKNFWMPLSMRSGGFSSPFSRPGRRPNITDTGTICTSRSGCGAGRDSRGTA